MAQKFPFGSHRKRNFTFTGLKIDQSSDHTITVSQEQYVKDIQPIKISRDRRLLAEDAVAEGERQSLRAIIGSLSYAAINSRPELGSRIRSLQPSINRAKVSTLCEAKLYADTTLKIHPIPLGDLRFIAFSDASFASERNPGSHQGMMIMSCHAKIGENRTSFVNPIIWHSKKIQKVAVSTLSAEAMALARISRYVIMDTAILGLVDEYETTMEACRRSTTAITRSLCSHSTDRQRGWHSRTMR